MHTFSISHILLPSLLRVLIYTSSYVWSSNIGEESSDHRSLPFLMAIIIKEVTQENIDLHKIHDDASTSTTMNKWKRHLTVTAIYSFSKSQVQVTINSLANISDSQSIYLHKLDRTPRKSFAVFPLYELKPRYLFASFIQNGMLYSEHCYLSYYVCNVKYGHAHYLQYFYVLYYNSPSTPPQLYHTSLLPSSSTTHIFTYFIRSRVSISFFIPASAHLFASIRAHLLTFF